MAHKATAAAAKPARMFQDHLDDLRRARPASLAVRSNVPGAILHVMPPPRGSGIVAQSPPAEDERYLRNAYFLGLGELLKRARTRPDSSLPTGSGSGATR